jgi:hypothetical protein
VQLRQQQKVRDVEVGHVCGTHGSVIGKMHSDRVCGGMLVAEGSALMVRKRRVLPESAMSRGG